MKIAMFLISLLSVIVFNPTQGIAQVPLPEEINIVVPGPDVPPEIAAFSGRWEGNWDRTLDAILVVTEINQREATVIYAWGDAPEWNTKKGYRKYKAVVIPGEKPKIKFGGKGAPEFTVEMRKDLKTVNIERESQGNIAETKLKKVN